MNPLATRAGSHVAQTVSSNVINALNIDMLTCKLLLVIFICLAQLDNGKSLYLFLFI